MFVEYSCSVADNGIKQPTLSSVDVGMDTPDMGVYPAPPIKAILNTTQSQRALARAAYRIPPQSLGITTQHFDPEGIAIIFNSLSKCPRLPDPVVRRLGSSVARRFHRRAANGLRACLYQRGIFLGHELLKPERNFQCQVNGAGTSTRHLFHSDLRRSGSVASQSLRA
ncbi:hypothetical protein M422DRAFT_243199 [Sphaerobolus stellatus SS14]|nr:hypothetical protein M422DRAFT_243199 [Sphaerobolus stellatus SS14]